MAKTKSKVETAVGGTVEFLHKGTITVGALSTWRLRYTVGPVGIPVGGGVRVALEHASDWGPPQVENPKDINYVSAKCSGRGKVTLVAGLTSFVPHVTAIVDGRRLNPGDTIEFILGDTSKGSPGLRWQTIAQEGCSINVFEDVDGSGRYIRLPDSPIIDVINEKEARLVALAKSQAIQGDEISLVVRAEDKFGNIVRNFRGVIEVIHQTKGQPSEEDFIEGCCFYPNDRGSKRVSGIVPDTPGHVRYRVVDPEKNMETVAGPILVRAPERIKADPETLNLYWGQLHGHSLLSIGSGTVDDYFLYARDKSNLDFAALTDTGIWTDADRGDNGRPVDPAMMRHYLDHPSWQIIREGVRHYNHPGNFVTFLAYEWISNHYGEKSIYFLDEDEMLEHPSSPDELYKCLQGRDALIISHSTSVLMNSSGMDWSCHDPALERLVEICSFQGVREFAGNRYYKDDDWSWNRGEEQKGRMAQDALAKGYRLGFTAGSDDRSGKPGSDVSGRLPCRLSSLTAVWAPRLDRESIWNALYNRMCYATTGARIFMSFYLNGLPMGSEVQEVTKTSRRDLFIVIYGTNILEKVEIVKNNREVHVERPGTYDTKIEWIDNAEFDTDCYYVRVTQRDGHRAWSSPIWVSRPPKKRKH